MTEPKIKITIEIDGVERVSYMTDEKGSVTVKDVITEVTKIIGERSLRKRKR